MERFQDILSSSHTPFLHQLFALVINGNIRKANSLFMKPPNHGWNQYPLLQSQLLDLWFYDILFHLPFPSLDPHNDRLSTIVDILTIMLVHRPNSGQNQSSIWWTYELQGMPEARGSTGQINLRSKEIYCNSNYRNSSAFAMDFINVRYFIAVISLIFWTTLPHLRSSNIFDSVYIYPILSHIVSDKNYILCNMIQNFKTLRRIQHYIIFFIITNLQSCVHISAHCHVMVVIF